MRSVGKVHRGFGAGIRLIGLLSDSGEGIAQLPLGLGPGWSSAVATPP